MRVLRPCCRARLATAFLASVFCALTFRTDIAGAQAGGPMVAPGWIHEHWTTADGLPVNSINTVVQGTDGYLWMATYDGLVRFDGVRFTVFNTATHTELPSNRFSNLVEATDGTFWLLTDQYHLIRLRNGRFTAFDGVDGLPHRDVLSLLVEPQGSLLIGTRAGLARYEDGMLERIAPDLVTRSVSVLFKEADGTVWAGGEDGIVRLEQDGKVQPVVPVNELPSLDVRGLALDGDSLWVVTTAGLVVWDVEAGRRIRTPAGLVGRKAYTVTLVEGSVWLHTDGGVHEIRDGRIVNRLYPNDRDARFRRIPAWTDGTGALWVNTGRRLLQNGQTIFHAGSQMASVVTDREGNIWIPTDGGLHRLRVSPFTVYGTENGLRNENIYPIFESEDGAIWLGTISAGVARIRDEEVRAYGPEVGVPSTVWALEGDGEGNLWIGGEDRLCRLPAWGAQAGFRDGVCRREGIPGSLANATVRAIHRRAGGSTWFGTESGLYRLHNSEFRRFTSENDAPERPVRVFLEGPDGVLWMGTNGGGIVRFDDGRFSTFSTSEGLCSDLVRALHFDEHGALWVGTEDRGLCRVDAPNGDLSAATVLHIDRRHGLYDYTVHQILDDGMGRLWMSGNRGIWMVSQDDFDAFVAGERSQIYSIAYTERNGLPTREANGGVHPAGIRASDGRLWFPTQAGAVAFDPKALTRNTSAPPVHIEEVAIGSDTERRILSEFDLSDGVVLTSKERRMEIAYTAPSFVDPANIQFRYRLEGFDDDWVTAGAQRLATYTNLRPGRYRFQVIAANAQGTWNETGAAFDVRVRPKWYETRVFLALVALLLVLLGLAIGLWRRRESDRRRRELEVQVDRRTEELSEALEIVAEQAAALEELDRTKSRFFANISHEFRTPLTVILGGLRDGLAGNFGALSEKLADRDRVILRNASRLQRLIDEVLDLNRLEFGKFELTPSAGDLAHTLQRIVEENVPLAERNSVDLVFEGDVERCPRVYDENKLEKIVSNLLSNALKFTPKGRAVRLNLHCGEEVEISVVDEGPGILAEAHEKVFERFVQLDSGAEKGGTGVGLALVKELVDLHSGTIMLESTPGEGSTFTVRLPLEEATLADVEGATKLTSAEAGGLAPHQEKEPVPAEEYEPGRGGSDVSEQSASELDQTTVLVIEDNDDVRAYVRRSLADTYRVLEAVDGEKGVQLAQEALPDLIVSDVMLPGIDGYEIARQLKARIDTECIPVVMLTARAADADQSEGYRSGAEVYLTKPFSPDTLRAAVARLLDERSRLRRRLQEETSQANEEPNGHATLHTRAHAVVLEHLYDENYDVEALVSDLGVSRTVLYRDLKDEAGFSPGALIRTVRLEKARELLSDGAGTVSEIAYAVGFKSLSHFTRSFREKYGEPPSQV